jgi:hypothetical protein
MLALNFPHVKPFLQVFCKSFAAPPGDTRQKHGINMDVT